MFQSSSGFRLGRMLSHIYAKTLITEGLFAECHNGAYPQRHMFGVLYAYPYPVLACC